MVATTVRAWRPYAGPVAFLLAATLAIGLLRGVVLPHHSTPPAHRPAPARAAARAPHKAYYTVHAGDTLSSIAVRTHLSTSALRRLNPHVEPTALFLGEKIRIR